MVSGTTSLSRHLALAEHSGSLPVPHVAPLILQMAFASKIIGREMRRAALVGKLGLVGEKNPTGDSQKKLDVYSNEVIMDAFANTGLVAGIVSEEVEELRVISCSDPAEFILCVDPLDGSSNSDINGSVGTIFSFYHRSTTGACDDIEGELRGGATLMAAGYVMYG
ncbi:MAG: class 1 fructose-bisphosphatase, partial [Gemmatimonadota bacterium]